MAPDEIPACVGLGIADTYAVRSNHGAAPYVVACLADGRWVCSCPAEHHKLRAGGRYCRPVREVIEMRGQGSMPATSGEQGGITT